MTKEYSFGSLVDTKTPRHYFWRRLYEYFLTHFITLIIDTEPQTFNSLCTTIKFSRRSICHQELDTISSSFMLPLDIGFITLTEA